MNETQKQKRKYGSYCLRGINGEKQRKCHTGECVNQIKKIPGEPTIRCKKGTRKCADQQCYTFRKKSKLSVTKTPYNSPKNRSKSNSTDRYISPIITQYDIDNFNEISSSENEVKVHPIIEKEEKLITKKTKRRSSQSNKKNKTKKNFTSHGIYGKQKQREKTVQFKEELKVEEPIQSEESIKLLDLPIINNTTSSQRRKKRDKKRKSSNRNVKTELGFQYNPISTPKSMKKSPTKEELQPIEEVLQEEELQPIEQLSQEEELQPIEQLSQEEDLQPIEQLSQEEDLQPIEQLDNDVSFAQNSFKSPISVEEEESNIASEESHVAAEESGEEEESNIASEESRVAAEESGEEEEDIASEKSRVAAEESGEEEPEEEEPEEKISGASSINSEGSSGGKKHSKKNHKKKSKKNHKKKSRKLSKKQRKNSSRKCRKK
jgi:hypothetical protein